MDSLSTLPPIVYSQWSSPNNHLKHNHITMLFCLKPDRLHVTQTKSINLYNLLCDTTQPVFTALSCTSCFTTLLIIHSTPYSSPLLSFTSGLLGFLAVTQIDHACFYLWVIVLVFPWSQQLLSKYLLSSLFLSGIYSWIMSLYPRGLPDHSFWHSNSCTHFMPWFFLSPVVCLFFFTVLPSNIPYLFIVSLFILECEQEMYLISTQPYLKA